jgi:Flp pilus assembly protein TadG
MNRLNPGEGKLKEHGQVLVLFAIMLPVFLVFVGLGVDFGFAYLTKTTLSKAVDAAALAALRNSNQGQSRAISIAQSAFDVNYQSALGRDVSPPVVNVALTTDASNNTVVNVSATATIGSFFIRLLPGYKTLKVSSKCSGDSPEADHVAGVGQVGFYESQWRRAGATTGSEQLPDLLR